MVFQHWKQLRYYRINAYIPRSIQDVILREIKRVFSIQGLDLIFHLQLSWVETRQHYSQYIICSTCYLTQLYHIYTYNLYKNVSKVFYQKLNMVDSTCIIIIIIKFIYIYILFIIINNIYMYINIYMYAYNIQNILFTLILQKKKLMVTFTIFTFTLHYIVLPG